MCLISIKTQASNHIPQHINGHKYLIISIASIQLTLDIIGLERICLTFYKQKTTTSCNVNKFITDIPISTRMDLSDEKK